MEKRKYRVYASVDIQVCLGEVEAYDEYSAMDMLKTKYLEFHNSVRRDRKVGVLTRAESEQWAEEE